MMILFFRNADRILRAEKYRSVQKLVSPLLDLELVRIHSVCSEHYLTFLLQQCFNVKEISLGMMTEISDKVWSDVLAKNSLAKLEKISCQKCTKVHGSTEGLEGRVGKYKHCHAPQNLSYIVADGFLSILTFIT